MTSIKPFKGAGIIATYRGNYVVGRRWPSPATMQQVMHLGGKLELGENAEQASFSEMFEELGKQILNADWIKRAKRHEHPDGSGNMCVSFRLELTDEEFARLSNAPLTCCDWTETECASFREQTGRTVIPDHPAIDAIFLTPIAQHDELVAKFRHFERSNDRANDGKNFAEKHPLIVTSLYGDITQAVLRGFQFAMLESLPCESTS